MALIAEEYLMRGMVLDGFIPMTMYPGWVTGFFRHISISKFYPMPKLSLIKQKYTWQAWPLVMQKLPITPASGLIWNSTSWMNQKSLLFWPVPQGHCREMKKRIEEKSA